MRRAFTLVELVFVIVVFGIIASIGADIIASMYENYLRTRAINRLQSQSEIVLEQIAKRLQYRIKDSVRAVNAEDNATSVLPSAPTTYEILEWVGQSAESLNGQYDGATYAPGWSGFIDLSSTETNATSIKTPGSRLDFAENIIFNLTNSDVNISDGTKDTVAIIFKGKSTYPSVDNYYTPIAPANNDFYLNVRRNGVDRFTIDGGDQPINGEIYEQYYLTHSAYAIIPVGGTANDFNLTLRYNYQPWENEDRGAGTSRVLAEHVSTFRFAQFGDTIRIKLCLTDANLSAEFEFGTCKEKVIY